MAGLALDLTVVDDDGPPWDFSEEAKRQKAIRLVREQRPYMLIGSPSCKDFSTWQALNMSKSKDPQAMLRAKTASIVHLDFVASLYEEQADGGRYFLHEHPLNATSWEVPSISRVLRRGDVERVHGDQCQYGASVRHGPLKGSPVKKPTGFMTNAPRVARALETRCTGVDGSCSRVGGGSHVLCSSRVAREAALYPRELCRAVLKGIRDQLREDGALKDGCCGV